MLKPIELDTDINIQKTFALLAAFALDPLCRLSVTDSGEAELSLSLQRFHLILCRPEPDDSTDQGIGNLPVQRKLNRAF